MFHRYTPFTTQSTIFVLCLLFLLGCNRAEDVAEPTPKPVEAATVDVPPTPTAEPTNTPEAVATDPAADPIEVPDPTIDPENDGTLLTVPEMQGDPFQIKFDEIDGLLVSSGIGPIAPASSISFNFTGLPGQTFKAQVEGGTFGNALLFNGIVVPVSSIQGRSNVWELNQGGQYQLSISNGGSGANYKYEFSLTKPTGEPVSFAPQKVQIGQGVPEQTFAAEILGSDPIVYFIDGFEGQKYGISLTSESSKYLFINVESGEIFESSVGSSSREFPPLPNDGEYRIEISGEPADPFELTVTLLPE